MRQLDIILREVSDYLGISINDIKSKTRNKSTVAARQIAIYLSRKYTKCSLHVIGDYYNKHHASVLYSQKAINNHLTYDKFLQNDISIISKKIENILINNTVLSETLNYIKYKQITHYSTGFLGYKY